MNTLTYDAGETLPDGHLTAIDDTGAVISLASGYTFSLVILDAAGATSHSQATGFTGASTSPNITVAWAAGFAALVAGRYTLKVTGTRTSDGKVRIWTFGLVIG